MKKLLILTFKVFQIILKGEEVNGIIFIKFYFVIYALLEHSKILNFKTLSLQIDSVKS